MLDVDLKLLRSWIGNDSIDEAAKKLGVSERTLYNIRKTGQASVKSITNMSKAMGVMPETLAASTDEVKQSENFIHNFARRPAIGTFSLKHFDKMSDHEIFEQASKTWGALQSHQNERYQGGIIGLLPPHQRHLIQRVAKATKATSTQLAKTLSDTKTLETFNPPDLNFHWYRQPQSNPIEKGPLWEIHPQIIWDEDRTQAAKTLVEAVNAQKDFSPSGDGFDDFTIKIENLAAMHSVIVKLQSVGLALFTAVLQSDVVIGYQDSDGDHRIHKLVDRPVNADPILHKDFRFMHVTREIILVHESHHTSGRIFYNALAPVAFGKEG